MYMYKIIVHDDKWANKLFTYESYIAPMVGDRYADPDGTGNHYEVTQRLLYATKDLNNVISVWVKKTS